MFLFYQKKEVTSKQRDDWGVLQEYTYLQDVTILTDRELAEALQTSLKTVETHRRD